MTASEKITILLADEDALRRDGLAAVLQSTDRHQVVAQCSDGEQALECIRSLRPQVAVIDLNIPKVHGIELVRRVRSEALGTRIVILSGTDNDEIVREVVRAGGDGYLLKNGPARHLVDAISYVRDGGQYFSPQLGRDGRDRHLLEETPRAAAAPATAPAAAGTAAEEAEAERISRGPRYGRSRSTARRGGEAGRLKDRFVSEAGGDDIGDREYEILDMMADGIRPILDRLDEIDARVGQMETGTAPVPENVRGWLSNQLADSLQQSGGRGVATGRKALDLEARLPKMIEEAVTQRFQQMAGKLQQEIEETHVRTLESFVKNVQVKLVQRVAALETDMSHQADAMFQLREYSQRTEDNLGRLIAGVDKLAQELPKRLQAGQAAGQVTVESGGGAPRGIPAPAPAPAPASAPSRSTRRRSARGFSPKLFWAMVAAVAVLAGAGYSLKNSMQTPTTAATTPGKTGEAPLTPAKAAEKKTRLEAAQEYMERKEYSLAEDVYRQILKSDPENGDVMKLLASALYRQDKIDESTAILDKLPKTAASGAGKTN